ncbi:hypothetical protein ACODT5_17925 [Streptomyces sp. 5.8]|uniref:hypothetical protein n=1 Tax=Streptomyces sp. 5.8 TaxID=3406571 RepID=UPI003BB6F1BA
MTRRDRVLAVLRRDPDLAGRAAESFGFDLDRAEHVEEVRLANGVPLRAVAGGRRRWRNPFLCTDEAVLHASSEGEAGLAGGDLDEGPRTRSGAPTPPGWTPIAARCSVGWDCAGSGNAFCGPSPSSSW